MAQGTEMMGFRVRSETKEAIEAAAKEAGSSVADYLRNLVEEASARRQGDGRPGGEGTAQAEVLELRRDLAAGLEVLGVMTCRLFARLSIGGSTTAEEKEFRAWIAENLRRA